MAFSDKSMALFTQKKPRLCGVGAASEGYGWMYGFT